MTSTMKRIAALAIAALIAVTALVRMDGPPARQHFATQAGVRTIEDAERVMEAERVVEKVFATSTSPQVALDGARTESPDLSDGKVALEAARANRSKPAAKKDATPTVTVRGGYVNDIGCIPLAPPTYESEKVGLECAGGSIWTGGWDGHTVIRLNGTVDTQGRIDLTFDEALIARYAADKTFGVIRHEGWVRIDEHGEFTGATEIVGGACDFEGSRGSMTFNGFSTHGGFIAEWIKPDVEPSDEPCDPTSEMPL